MKLSGAPFCFSLALVLAGLHHAPCGADSGQRKLPVHAIAQGMEMQAVLKQWGPADLKLERETSRHEQWNYPGAELVFFEGALRSWKLGLNSSAMAHSGGLAVVAPFNSDKASRSESPESAIAVSKDTEAILSEILKEVPSSPDAPSAPSPASPIVSVTPPPSLHNPFSSNDMLRRMEPIELEEIE